MMMSRRVFVLWAAGEDARAETSFFDLGGNGRAGGRPVAGSVMSSACKTSYALSWPGCDRVDTDQVTDPLSVTVSVGGHDDEDVGSESSGSATSFRGGLGRAVRHRGRTRVTT